MSGIHAHHHAHHESRGQLTSRAALASVAMALFLLGLKIYASIQTGSVAMLGSLADTSLDVLASLITLFGVRIAAMPADQEHRFGHGKAEGLAAMAQVLIISLSALGIGWRAIHQFGSDTATRDFELGAVVSGVAMLTTVALLAYQRHVIRKTGSVAIATDNLHYKSDLLLNLSVIVALLLDQRFGLRWADPLFGLLIAGWLLFGAWRAASQALDQLMDREWADDRRAELLRIARDHPQARGIHELRTRTSGGHDFAQFHLSLDPATPLSEVHHIMDAIEARIHTAFPGVEILIHPDPYGLDEPGQDTSRA